MALPIDPERFEHNREFILDQFKTKIQEHINYWLTLGIVFFASEQLFLEQTIRFSPTFSNFQLFVVSVIFFIGGTIFVIGRICYWECFISFLFRLRIDDIKKVSEFGLKQDILNTLTGMINKGPGDKVRRSIGKHFIKIDSLIIIIILGLIVSIIYVFFFPSIIS